MAKRARRLDLIPTHVETDLPFGMAKVWYGFPVGEMKLYHADIYPESGFDVSTVQIGVRQFVQTENMNVRVWNKSKQDFEFEDRYVWKRIWEPMRGAALGARSSAERKRSEDLAAKPLANPGLFGF